MRRGPLRAEILQIAAQLFLRGDRDALLQGGDVLLGQKPGVDLIPCHRGVFAGFEQRQLAGILTQRVGRRLGGAGPARMGQQQKQPHADGKNSNGNDHEHGDSFRAHSNHLTPTVWAQTICPIPVWTDIWQPKMWYTTMA